MNSETDLLQAAPVGSSGCQHRRVQRWRSGDALYCRATGGDADGGGDASMFIFYNQIKSIPGFLIEPYYVLYLNQMGEKVNAAQGLGTAQTFRPDPSHGWRSD